MFSRTSRAERTAAQAWDYLSSAVASAGDSAREAGRHTVDVTSTTAASLAGEASRRGTKLANRAGRKSTKLAKRTNRQSAKLANLAGTKVNSVADEAWTRANAAANALAGQKPGLPWGLIVGAGLIGVAVGWAAASAARAALERQAEQEELELAETAVIVTPATSAQES
ncbi:hypothetical protein [Jidongwangia harbinensis]|uniref:hypothetical protein n=1 Tax=Jidongwangia harbinensis TaxID=2878561 RepID=UPI001CDA185D|nr:hypothetical protein [Jidongwangia harbinensis]MCA2218462.1 hypothetical protein [Jidongwangia harbinensis]